MNAHTVVNCTQGQHFSLGSIDQGFLNVFYWCPLLPERFLCDLWCIGMSAKSNID